MNYLHKSYKVSNLWGITYEEKLVSLLELPVICVDNLTITSVEFFDVNFDLLSCKL